MGDRFGCPPGKMDRGWILTQNLIPRYGGWPLRSTGKTSVLFFLYSYTDLQLVATGCFTRMPCTRLRVDSCDPGPAPWWSCPGMVLTTLLLVLMHVVSMQ